MPPTRPEPRQKPAAKPTGDDAHPGRRAGRAPRRSDRRAEQTCPRSLPPTSTEPEVVVVAPPKKKRRRWPWVLLVIAAGARDPARDRLRRRRTLRQELRPRLHQAAHRRRARHRGPVDREGRRRRVRCCCRRSPASSTTSTSTAESVTFGTLTGAATVHAEGVPLDANAQTEKLDVTFAMPEDQVARRLGGNLSGLTLDSIALEEPKIMVTATLNLFFFTLPVGMGIVPSAADGELVFTPTTVTLGRRGATRSTRPSRRSATSPTRCSPSSRCASTSPCRSR